MSKIYLEKVVELLGGKQRCLADALATPENPIKQAHVWKWLNTTADGIPERHVLKACEAVNWQVTPHELRPDIYPYQHDALPEHLRISNEEAAA